MNKTQLLRFYVNRMKFFLLETAKQANAKSNKNSTNCVFDANDL